jgi:hypothetical protein
MVSADAVHGFKNEAGGCDVAGLDSQGKRNGFVVESEK